MRWSQGSSFKSWLKNEVSYTCPFHAPVAAATGLQGPHPTWGTAFAEGWDDGLCLPYGLSVPFSPLCNSPWLPKRSLREMLGQLDGKEPQDAQQVPPQSPSLSLSLMAGSVSTHLLPEGPVGR